MLWRTRCSKEPSIPVGLGRDIIHESQDLSSVGQHNLRIKTLNKSNTYLSSMRSVSYLHCRETCAYIQESTSVLLFHTSSSICQRKTIKTCFSQPFTSDNCVAKYLSWKISEKPETSLQEFWSQSLEYGEDMFPRHLS